MYEVLLEMIDIERVENALTSLKVQIPPPITLDDTNFTKFETHARISLVQVNYFPETPEEPFIGKVYVNINPLTELAFDSDYHFYALNFYQESNECLIHSYGGDGIRLAGYHINRFVLENPSEEDYMVKSNGDVYHPRYRASDNPLVNQIRLSWEEHLLCYSVKQDGRLSFYILVNLELDTHVTKENFIATLE